MLVRFLPEAEAELLHEVEYYARARAGTGVRFQAAVEASVERVRRHRKGGAMSHHGTRAAMVKGFPFSIIYRASESELLIVAIAPHRKRPGYWAQRIGDE